ncbi:hypothetical protein D9613_007895 [Agrocybe pediades]|uniref:Uncharacterized protein n=1 Tax=Agrocybe pediades TaxID=84607 RepID=A0A8H4QMK7_9AGAR|nr:hypothetical protein D9613_007895 [Agrocybe pediades]
MPLLSPATTDASSLVSSTMPHPFRPKVRAADRIFSWSSPFSREFKTAHEASLNPNIVASAYRVVSEALATNTRITYAAGVARFHEFCDANNVDERQRMPASAVLLTAFVDAHCGRFSGSTIRTWLSGIRAWHLCHGAPWEGDSDWVGWARVAAQKQGVAHKRPTRAPVSLEHLRALRLRLNLVSSSRDIALWAAVLVTFWGCRRLGETIVSRAGDFDPKHHMRDRPVFAKHRPDQNRIRDPARDSAPTEVSEHQINGHFHLTIYQPPCLRDEASYRTVGD